MRKQLTEKETWASGLLSLLIAFVFVGWLMVEGYDVDAVIIFLASAGIFSVGFFGFNYIWRILWRK